MTVAMAGSSIVPVSAVSCRGGGHAAAVVIAAVAVAVPAAAVLVGEALGCEGCYLLRKHASTSFCPRHVFSSWPGGHSSEWH
jgi:hypothetical protein